MKEVSTSFLSDKDYKKTILELNKTNTDYIHFDVMDGKFVDNKNLSIKELTTYLDLSIKKNDIHLMVNDPLKYIEKIYLYNIDYVTIHYEIKNLDKVIDKIKEYGLKVGVSLKPNTDVEEIYKYLDKINMVLIMSVEPGKSGQTFIENSIEKVNKLKEEIIKRNLTTKIEIDGGVNDNNISKLSNVDIVVSASYILNDYKNIDKIKNI
jgi:ribulose-phosphate 3-epimerase